MAARQIAGVKCSGSTFDYFPMAPACGHHPRCRALNVSAKTNQGEVSFSPMGAVLAIWVGNMLSYIARAS
jgi:hypothetical protein